MKHKHDMTVHTEAQSLFDDCIDTMKVLSRALTDDINLTVPYFVSIPFSPVEAASDHIELIHFTDKGAATATAIEVLTQSYRLDNQLGRNTLRAAGMMKVSPENLERIAVLNRKKKTYNDYLKERMNEKDHPGSRRRFNRSQKGYIPLQITRTISTLSDANTVSEIKYIWQDSDLASKRTIDQIKTQIFKMAGSYAKQEVTSRSQFNALPVTGPIQGFYEYLLLLDALPKDELLAEYRPKAPQPRAYVTFKTKTTVSPTYITSPMPIVMSCDDETPRIIKLEDFDTNREAVRNRSGVFDDHPLISSLNIYRYKIRRKSPES